MKYLMILFSLTLGFPLILLSQGVVAPFQQKFDVPPVVLVPGVGTTGLGAAWDYHQSGTSAAFCRAQIVNGLTVSTQIDLTPPTLENNGAFVLQLDLSSAEMQDGINTIVLHINGTASNSLGMGYRIHVLLRDPGDETDAADVIAFQDGLTLGDGVTNTGASTGAPGQDSFKEVLLSDWNSAGIDTMWRDLVFEITPAFLAANGLLTHTDHRFIIRQRDNLPAPGDGLLVDLVRVARITAQDVGVTAIVSPSSSTSCVPQGNVPVTITVTNYGLTLPTNTVITCNYSTATLTNFSQFTLATPLTTLESRDFTFITPVNMPTIGAFAISASAFLAADGNIANNALGVVVVNGMPALTTFPFTESFDGLVAAIGVAPPAGWKQETTDATGGITANWLFRNTPTGTAGTGPAADHTTGTAGVGFFGYVQDASSDHAMVNLRTPCLDLVNLKQPELSFWYHSNNANMPPTNFENFIHVDLVLYPSGTIVQDITPPIGHVDQNWNQRTVSLASFPRGIVEIRFRGTSNGGSSLHDVCIDDVSVYDAAPPGSGQNPQPGVAVLDINNSLEGGAEGVSSGLPGPYFAQVSQFGSSPVLFTIQGVPNQPIILLGGLLNPGVVTFPGVGQVDLGTPNLLPPFLPNGIFIIADGASGTGFLPSFFVTNSLGTMQLSLGSTSLPVGLIGAFQAAVFNGGPTIISISNAVELTVM